MGRILDITILEADIEDIVKYAVEDACNEFIQQPVGHLLWLAVLSTVEDSVRTELWEKIGDTIDISLQEIKSDPFAW